MSEDKYIKVGQYLTLGSYFGEPVLWRAISLREGIITLMSEKILCLKAFDAAESGFYNQGGSNHHTTEDKRKEKGSNDWAKSNIREWLNSCDKPVAYTTQAPTRSAVELEFNPYDREAGFLSGFSEIEKRAIGYGEHKALICGTDKRKTSTGEEPFAMPIPENSRKLTTRVITTGNYHNAFGRMFSDKVMLPNISDISDLIDLESNSAKYPTAQAVKRCEINPYYFGIEFKEEDNTLSEDNQHCYWTMDASSVAPVILYSIYGERFVGTPAYSGECGVCPIIQVKQDLVVIGEGSKNNPRTLI